MLIRELLLESPSDDVDLQNIARYISSYIRHKQLLGNYNFRFKLSALFKKISLSPNIRNNDLKEKLSKLTIIVRTEGRDNLNGFFRPDDFIITIYMFGLPTEFNLQSTLIHELQHAWDYARSEGKDWTETDIHTYEYTKSVEEINARFAQALMNLGDLDLSSNKNILLRIKAVFYANSLFPELYDNLPNGRQKYNQLLKRAYKFCKEVNNYEKFNHEELPSQTLKKLVAKTLREIINN